MNTDPHYLTLKARISMGFGFSILFLLWGIPIILIMVGVDTHTFLSSIGLTPYQPME